MAADPLSPICLTPSALPDGTMPWSDGTPCCWPSPARSHLRPSFCISDDGTGSHLRPSFCMEDDADRESGSTPTSEVSAAASQGPSRCGGSTSRTRQQSSPPSNTHRFAFSKSTSSLPPHLPAVPLNQERQEEHWDAAEGVATREMLQEVCAPFFNQMLDAVENMLIKRIGVARYRTTASPGGSGAPPGLSATTSLQQPPCGVPLAQPSPEQTSTQPSPLPGLPAKPSPLPALRAIATGNATLLEVPARLRKELMFDAVSLKVPARLPTKELSDDTVVAQSIGSNDDLGQSESTFVKAACEAGYSPAVAKDCKDVCHHWTFKGWCRLERRCKFLHPECVRGSYMKLSLDNRSMRKHQRREARHQSEQVPNCSPSSSTTPVASPAAGPSSTASASSASSRHEVPPSPPPYQSAQVPVVLDSAIPKTDTRSYSSMPVERYMTQFQGGLNNVGGVLMFAGPPFVPQRPPL